MNDWFESANIRISLNYVGKVEGAHRFQVEFYNPKESMTGTCLMDIAPGGSTIYPHPGETVLQEFCTDYKKRNFILDLVPDLGKVYVAGLERKSTYFWTDKNG